MNRAEAGRLGAEKTNLVIRERYGNNPKTCVFCGKDLPYEKRKNKFCDQSCAASHNNVGVRRNGDQGDKFCLFCGTQLVGRKYVNKYCSMKCNKNHIWLVTKSEIEKTGVVDSHVSGRRFLSDTKGCKCDTCGISEWNGNKLSLVLDHINGNPEDWHVENLRLLCPNCDSLTPTFKGRNKGNGRFARRLRYKDGKSY
jgi:hypothetical protein